MRVGRERAGVGNTVDTNTIVGLRVSVETTTAQPAVSTPPPPLPPPPRRPAPPDFGFQINGSFFFPRLDSTRLDAHLPVCELTPTTTFLHLRNFHLPLASSSLFRALFLFLPPPFGAIHGVTTPLPNAPCTSALCDFECGLQPAASAMTRSLLMEDSRLGDSSNHRFRAQPFKRVRGTLAGMIYHCRQLRWINDAAALPRD